MKHLGPFILMVALAFALVGFFLSQMQRSARDLRGPELYELERELTSLRQEASAFFYDAMRELFAGTYDAQDGYVGQYALGTFNEYRARLEPRCRLINVYPEYGTFYGEALFPSGDVFEVGMTKRDQGWELHYFNHVGTEHYYHDLQKEE